MTDKELYPGAHAMDRRLYQWERLQQVRNSWNELAGQQGENAHAWTVATNNYLNPYEGPVGEMFRGANPEYYGTTPTSEAGNKGGGSLQDDADLPGGARTPWHRPGITRQPFGHIRSMVQYAWDHPEYYDVPDSFTFSDGTVYTREQYQAEKDEWARTGAGGKANNFQMASDPDAAAGDPYDAHSATGRQVRPNPYPATLEPKKAHLILAHALVQKFVGK